MAVNNNRKIKRKVRNAYIISTVSIALVLFYLCGKPLNSFLIFKNLLNLIRYSLKFF